MYTTKRYVHINKTLKEQNQNRQSQVLFFVSAVGFIVHVNGKTVRRRLACKGPTRKQQKNKKQKNKKNVRNK